MGTRPYPKREDTYITFEEYLVRESESEYRSEYHDGKIIAMAGGTSRHSAIAQNARTAISNALRAKNKKCIVYDSDFKVRIESMKKGVYPDASVICDKPEYYNNRQDICTNPLLIVEVLSKSTRNYDKGDKFTFYRTLPSFKEYVLIYQDEPKVEAWYKIEENIWRISNFKGLDPKLTLFSLDCEIQLGDIYYLQEDFPENPGS